MKTRFRWIAVILCLFLFFFVIMGFVFRDFVRESLVMPALYALWLGGLIVNSVSQIYYLTGLLFLGLLLAVASLRYLLTSIQFPAEKSFIVDEQSRYQFWRKRCQRIASGGFFLSNLGMELRRLVLMVLAYQEHRDMWDLERQIVENEFDVPPDVQALIAQRQLGPSKELRGPRAWLVRLFRAFRKVEEADNSPRQRVENIVAYLEKRLEVKHDRRDW